MKNNKASHFFVMMILATALISCGQEGLKPDALVVSEGFENPLGFYDSHPGFSWKLPVVEGVTSQSAYRIVVASDPKLLPDQADLWDSEEVKSDQSAWVKYEGKPLGAREKAYWSTAQSDDLLARGGRHGGHRPWHACRAPGAAARAGLAHAGRCLSVRRLPQRVGGRTQKAVLDLRRRARRPGF